MTKEERDNVIRRELKIITALDVIDNTMREIRTQLMYLTDEVCKATRKDEPQMESLEQFRVGLEYHTDTTHFGKAKGESTTTNSADTPQTDCDRYAIVNDEGEREYNCIGCQTDCAWK